MLRAAARFLTADAVGRTARAAYTSHLASISLIRQAAAHPRVPRWLIWISIALVAPVLLPVLGGVANAAVQLWGAADADFAHRAINAIFPESGATMLTLGVGVLSAALSAIVVGTLAWQTFGLMLGASGRGEVQWRVSGILRFLVFAGLLIPSPTTGLSGAHHLAREAALFTSDLATEIAATGAESVLSAWQGAPSTAAGFGTDQDLGGLALTRQILESETCGILVAWTAERATEIAGGNTLGGADLGQNPPLPHSPIPAIEGIGDNRTRYWRWGRWASCGSLGLAEPAAAMDWQDRYRESRISALSDLLAAIRESGVPARLAEHRFTGVVEDWDDEFLAKLAPYARSYDRAVAEAASVLLSRTDGGAGGQIVSAIRAQGWPALGALYSSIASASGRALDLAAQAPLRLAPQLDRLERDAPQYRGFAELLKRSWKRQAEAPQLTGEMLSAGADGEASLFAQLINPVTRPVTNALISLGSSNPHDPLRGGIGFGHTVTTAAEVGIVGGAVIAGAAGLTGPTAKAFDWIAGYVRPLIWLVYAAGWVHAYLLPMLPFISIVFAYILFLFGLTELLIALPIFCFLGARVDGEEFVHAVIRPGLVLMANAVLRPIFTVLAFFAALVLMLFPFWLVDSLFAAAWQGAQGGYAVMIGGVLGALVLLTWLHWQIAVRILAGINEVPDRILAYWGGAASDGASEARNTAVAAGIFMNGGNSVGRRVPPGGGGGGGGSGVGETPGIRPVEAAGGVHPSSESAGAAVGGGSGGGGQAQPWFRASGDLSPAQQASAQTSYAKYAAANPEGASALGGYEGYVAHAQQQEAKRRGGG